MRLLSISAHKCIAVGIIIYNVIEISIVTIFHDITCIDQREKIVNFSLQYKQAISTYV